MAWNTEADTPDPHLKTELTMPQDPLLDLRVKPEPINLGQIAFLLLSLTSRSHNVKSDKVRSGRNCFIRARK
jgi:hypothetical protein